MGDYTLGYVKNPRMKISEAVAASAGFPVGIEPLELKPADYDWFEFAREHTGTDALRELYNPDIKLDEVSNEPHYLSVVLSSALYEYMIKLYDRRRTVEADRLAQENERLMQDGKEARFIDPFYSSMGKALALAAHEFVGFVLPALDFLPPGELSFADVGRAIIATQRVLLNSDDASDSQKSEATERISFLLDTFNKRGMTVTVRPSEIRTEFRQNILQDVNLWDLFSSDWIAYRFATENREMLSIPSDSAFAIEVMPRVVARKLPFSRSGPRQNHLFFKVRWNITEKMAVKRGGLPASRRLVVGTMLVIDLDQGKPVALLHTDQDPALRQTRDEMLEMLLNRDLLRFGAHALGPHGQRLDGVFRAEASGGSLKLSHVADMLHITHDHKRGASAALQ
jgi:hypothetical protein